MSVMTIGFWAYRLALGILVWELTESFTWLGIVAFAEMVPMVLIGPIAGTIVDQKGALKIGRLVQFLWGVIVAIFAAITYAGWATLEVVLVVAVVQGAVGGFANPSHLALVAKLVPKEDLPPAVALQSGTVQTGRFIGPAVAGSVILFGGTELVFALVAVGFFFFTLMLMMARTIEPEMPNPSSRGLMGDFVDGLQYAAGHFEIKAIILFTAIMSILLRPLPELLPGAADVVFSLDKDGLAALVSAFGVGAMISAIWIAIRGKIEGLTRVFWATLLLGAAALFAFGLTRDFWVALVLSVLVGFGSNTVSICSQTLVQHLVQSDMRARVMSLLGITFRAIPALGALLQGVAASWAGFSLTVIVCGGLCALAWLWLTRTIKGRTFESHA